MKTVFSMKNVTILLICFYQICLSNIGLAAEESSSDNFGRETPLGTITGYFNAVETGDFELASEYLDLRNLPSELSKYTPGEIALGLSIVLDRSTWIALENFSVEEQGHSNDGLPSYRDQLAEISFDGNTQLLYLQRVPADNDTFVWKVSNATIAKLPDYYEEYRYSPYVEWLFEALPDVRILGVHLFKWVTVLSITLASAPFVLLLAWWLTRLFIKPERPLYQQVRRFLMGPCSALVLAELAAAILLNFGGEDILALTSTQSLPTLVFLWLIYAAVDLHTEFYANYLRRKGREGSVSLLGPIGNALKAVFLLIGVLVWLDNLGYSIAALLTGLGVGGVAVALVLQKPLEDVFGAITLYTQQPVKIGDFGRYAHITGVIEEISLRTTRIRTLDNTVVAVPNALMASQPIENYSVRNKILYKPSILLNNSTSTVKIQTVINKIRVLLNDEEIVLDKGARVNFTEIGAEGFELKVFAYINTTDFPSYLLAAEKLNLGILGILDTEGVTLQRAIAELLQI